MSAEAVAEPKTVASSRVFEQKWGKALMDGGYLVVPNVVIRRHKQLGLDAIELALYVLIASFWWKPEERPFPSISELAKGMGMHERNIQRRLRRMHALGFIKIYKRPSRYGGNKSNEYDLTPLIREATKIAVAEAAQKKKASLAKLGRKVPAPKPALQVVKA
jgi:DNA-binding MarR family transcriptional regulator